MNQTRAWAVRTLTVGLRLPALDGLSRIRLASPIGELAAIVLLVPILLHPALWNGFPLLFYDTGAYMLQGFGRLFVPERSPVYSLFLDFAGGRISLWLVACVQCLIAAVAIVQFARAVRPSLSLRMVLAIGAVLSLFTSLAWVTGQIEPDFLTPLVALAIYPLAFCRRRLGGLRTLVLIAIGGFAIACHPSHIGLAAGLILCVAGLRLAALFRRALPRPHLAAPLLCLGLAVAMVLAANYALTRHVFLNRAGTVFFAAKLIGDGVAKRTMDATCADHYIRLCPYRDHLPKSADAYLWGPKTPFNTLGRFYCHGEDYAYLVSESLKRYPLRIFGSGLLSSVRQFFMVRTGDGIAPVEWVLNSGFAHYLPKQIPAYLTARQQEGATRFDGVNVVHVPLALGSLLLLALVLRQAVRERHGRRAALYGFVFLALIGNALVCGMFSGPHDRYQARIVWIAPLVLMLGEGRALRRLLPRAIRR